MSTYILGKLNTTDILSRTFSVLLHLWKTSTKRGSILTGTPSVREVFRNQASACYRSGVSLPWQRRVSLDKLECTPYWSKLCAHTARSSCSLWFQITEDIWARLYLSQPRACCHCLHFEDITSLCGRSDFWSVCFTRRNGIRGGSTGRIFWRVMTAWSYIILVRVS